jgi:ketosteroid isomerase-like protein
MNKIEFIARIRFLAWMGYQMGSGQPYNVEPIKDQFDALKNGVEFALKNPNMTPEQNHENWMKCKAAQGWIYGTVKDFEKKTHPDMVPFNELPRIEQDKDIMDGLMNKEAEKIWNETRQDHERLLKSCKDAIIEGYREVPRQEAAEFAMGVVDQIVRLIG